MRRLKVLATALGLLGTLSVLGVAAAQRPLNAPNYYLFQLPELALEQTLEGELTPDDGQNFKDGSYLDLYAFNGLAGESVSLTASSSDFDAYLSVFDPQGRLLAANDDDGGMAGDAGITLELPSDGRYLVVVSGYAEYDLGAYSVTLSDSRAAWEPLAQVTSLPAVIASQVTPDMPGLPNSWIASTEYFSFEVSDDVLLVATMTSPEFDTVLTLLDASGKQLGQNDDANFTSDSELVARLTPGTYFIAASSYYEGSYGAYQLTLETYVPSR